MWCLHLFIMSHDFIIYGHCIYTWFSIFSLHEDARNINTFLDIDSTSLHIGVHQDFEASIGEQLSQLFFSEIVAPENKLQNIIYCYWA